MCAMTGLSSTGTIGLVISFVRGRRRVPRPAARTIALIAPASYRNSFPGAAIDALVLAQLVDAHAQGLKLQTCHLVVDPVWDRQHARLQLAGARREILRAQGLSGKGHVHHRGRV